MRKLQEYYPLNVCSKKVFGFIVIRKKMVCPHQEPGGEADWCLLQEQHEEGEQTKGKAVWGHTGEQLVALVVIRNIQVSN